MAAISGTFNIIDPDERKRADGFRRLQTLANACSLLGTSVITICSGTCDPDNMWRRHPDNDRPETWALLLESMRRVTRIGEQSAITMAFEPEVNNVVDSAQKGRRLLDEISSPLLKVVLDGANLFPTGTLARMQQVLDEAVSLLGPDIAIAHAKDLTRDGDAGDCPAGSGVLDYDYYLSRLCTAGFDGPLITHGLSEQHVPATAAFLQNKLRSLANSE